MDGDSAIVDGHRTYEPEIGDGLVELGIGDRPECLEDLGFSAEHGGGHSDTLSLAPAATSTPASAGRLRELKFRGTSMSYNVAALSPRIFRF